MGPSPDVLDSRTTASPAIIVGRYRVVRLIAHGGMGSLYLARDPAIDRTIAIKLLQEGIRRRVARASGSRARRARPGVFAIPTS